MPAMPDPSGFLAVVTIDQRRSRTSPDRVESLLADLAGSGTAAATVLRFERTAGDEVQGLIGSPAELVELVLWLVRAGSWSTGVGLGPVRRPLPDSARAGAGPAFEHARAAVERAKRHVEGVAVAGPDAAAARHAEAVLQLLAALVQRRSPQGWQAVDLVGAGLTQVAAARRLGVSRQAVGQRLQAALWPHEQSVRPVAADLLARAAGPAP
jgi:phage-related baseplate assembly protein